LARLDSDAAALAAEITTEPDQPAVVAESFHLSGLAEALKELGPEAEAEEIAKLQLPQPEAEILAEVIASLRKPHTTTPEDADRARRDYARRSIADFLDALRTAHEPDPSNIPALAEVIARAADLLSQSAAAPEASPMLNKALAPAARAAVTLAAFVNGPCRNHALQNHADACAEAVCWPRIHYANATRNADADKLFREFRIGASRPHRTAKHAGTGPNSRAFDRTLDALLLLLPDALRPDVFPVLPILLDKAGQPIPPRTAEGKLAEPYIAIARFILTIRHTPDRWHARRDEALRTFLAENDAAFERLHRTEPEVRANYRRNRRRLIRASRNRSRHRLKARTEGSEARWRTPPAWLCPVAPVIETAKRKSRSKYNEDVLPPRRLPKLADALLPIYWRTIAENDARAEARRLRK
jgi:hypothetical protein